MDQGSDRNSLSHSLRVMPVDLSPHGFERVYAVPGRDDLLMRTNGALYAVFDQSTYSRDPQRRGAMRAVVPAATVFYIGRPDFRTIRSTGVRDVDFVQGDASRSPRASSALDSVHGVRRLDGSPIDGRAADAGAAPVDGRASSHGDAPTKPGAGARGESPSTTEGASPEGAPASRPQDPVRADAPAPTAPAPESRPAPPPPPMREDLPGFRDRIDELLRRAKKPS